MKVSITCIFLLIVRLVDDWKVNTLRIILKTFSASQSEYLILLFILADDLYLFTYRSYRSIFLDCSHISRHIPF